MSQILKGEVDNYKFTKINGEMIQADFKYNDVKKLIMMTTKGITIK